MFLISVDPHIKHCDFAIFSGNPPELRVVDSLQTNTIVMQPIELISCQEEKILVVEGQWVGNNARTSIALAQTAGMIIGAFMRVGYKIIEAPAWGPKSWIVEMLSIGGRMPNRKQISKLSMLIAKQKYPDFKFNEHQAAAVLMGLWYLKMQNIANWKGKIK